MAIQVAKTAAALMERAKVLFMPPETESRDTLVVAIGTICHKVFGTDYNNRPDMLQLPGIGQVTRRRVVAQYRTYLKAARKAGWEVIIDDGSKQLSDEIDI